MRYSEMVIIKWPSKRVPSEIIYNNDNSIPIIYMDFQCCMQDSNCIAADLDIEMYKKLLYTFNFSFYEYDVYDPNTDADNQKMIDMLKKILRIEEGIESLTKSVDKELEKNETAINDSEKYEYDFENLDEEVDKNSKEYETDNLDQDIANIKVKYDALESYYINIITKLKNKYDKIEKENDKLKKIIKSFCSI